MKRKNKKNGIIAAVVALSGVSLVSVGFASWIISGGQEVNVAGSIEADQVEDKRFLIDTVSGYYTGTTIDFHDDIVFGHPATGTNGTTDGWLQYDSSNKAENLTAITYFWVANLDTTITFDGNLAKKGSETVVKINPISITTNASAYTAAVDAGLIGALPTPVLSLAETDNTRNDGTLNWVKIKATVTFSWGTHGNIYSYYNGLGYTKERGDAAYTDLTTLRGVNGLSYTTKIMTGSLIV